MAKILRDNEKVCEHWDEGYCQLYSMNCYEQDNKCSGFNDIEDLLGE